MAQAKLSYLDLYTTDPAWNLAAEQYVFDCLPRDQTYFMLWQNDNAIIIGKHQNAAAEINQQFVRENGVRVVRRLSGGGGGKTAQIAVPEEPAAKALEKRYHCARRAVTEYTVRTVDGDFGIVFQHLADLSREECVLLARLLGEQAQNISRS